MNDPKEILTEQVNKRFVNQKFLNEAFGKADFYYHIVPENLKWEVVHSSQEDYNRGGGQVIKDGLPNMDAALKIAKKLKGKNEKILVWQKQGGKYVVSKDLMKVAKVMVG